MFLDFFSFLAEDSVRAGSFLEALLVDLRIFLIKSYIKYVAKLDYDIISQIIEGSRKVEEFKKWGGYEEMKKEGRKSDCKTVSEN